MCKEVASALTMQLDMNTGCGLAAPGLGKSNTAHYLTIISTSASRPKMQDLCVFFVSRKVEPLPKRLTLLSCPGLPVRPIAVFLASPTTLPMSIPYIYEELCIDICIKLKSILNDVDDFKRFISPITIIKPSLRILDSIVLFQYSLYVLVD